MGVFVDSASNILEKSSYSDCYVQNHMKTYCKIKRNLVFLKNA